MPSIKTSDKKVAGVLHHASSRELYQLRRFQPPAQLATLIEQFWLVDWDLTGQPSHVQQNLPDPNMHLVITHTDTGITTKIMGPVSKKYQFTMQGQGKIIGVKFNLGVFSNDLPCSASSAVDKEFTLDSIFTFETGKLQEQLLSATDDNAVVQCLSAYLADYPVAATEQLKQLTQLVELIKSQRHITQVGVLAAITAMPIRHIQRLFKHYLGLTPKWLIRKYRLHQALDMLENQKQTLPDLAAELHYADQSHLIRDFNQFLNITPKQYQLLSEGKSVRV